MCDYFLHSVDISSEAPYFSLQTAPKWGLVAGAGLRKEDWPLPDPKGQGLEAVQETRDKIRVLVLDLLKREGWGR